MDYEKKYNEALERARALWREAIEKEYVDDYLKDYETIFPELRESEDERIRKFLLDYAIEMIAGLESDISLSTYDGIKGHDPDAEAELTQWQKARAYLEKQKDLALTWEDMRKIINIDIEMIDDPEEHPEWMEEQPFYEEILKRYLEAKK